MSTPGLEFDWEANRANLMRCKFVPRTTFAERPLRDGIAQFMGHEFNLEILWRMDADDSYPDEYALTTPSSCKPLIDVLGIAWIASGDVEVLEVFDEDGT